MGPSPAAAGSPTRDPGFRAVVDAMPDAVVVVSASGEVVLANGRAADLFGYEPDELAGLSAETLLPPGLREDHRAGHAVGLTVVRKDGAEVPVEVSVSTWEPEPGEALLVVGVRDVTERRQLERYRRISESVSDMSFCLRGDGEGGLVAEWATESFVKATGVSPETWAPTTDWRSLVHPDDLDVVEQMHADLMAGAPAASGQLRIVPVDGEPWWVECTVTTDRDPETGAIERVYGTSRDIDEQKRAEVALAASESMLREAQAVGHLGSWKWDIPSDTVAWSEELYRIYGLTPGTFDPTFEGYFEHVHPDDRAMVLSDVERAFDQGGVYEHEYRIVRPDGEVRWLFTRAETLVGADGTRLGMQGVCWDITDRRRAEERYLRISEAVSDIAFEYRVEDGRLALEWVTDAYTRVTGYPLPDPLPREIFADVVHPDDRHLIDRAEAEVLAGARSAVELRIVCADGSVRWMRIYGQPLVDEATGAVTRAYGGAQDVTDRHEAEEALAQSEARLRDAARVAALGSYYWDLERDTKTWTDELYRLHGYEPGEFEPNFSSFVDTVHPADRDHLEAVVTRALAEGGRFEEEFRIIRKDGAVRWVVGTGEVVTDARGVPVALFGTRQDITARKATEERHRIVSDLVSDMAYVIRVDPVEGMVLEWATESFTRITGYTPEEWKANGGWLGLVPPEHLPDFGAGIETLLQGEVWTSEGPIVRKDGERRWLRAWSRPVVDPATGVIERIYGAAQDVTERHHAERALAESEARLRQAQTIAHVGSWTAWLPEGRVEWSEELYRIHGVDPDTYTPSLDTDLALIHPADRDAMRVAVERALRERRPAELEHRIVHAGGSARWVLSRIEILENPATLEVTGMAGTSYDITERRLHEERYRSISELVSDVAFSFRVAETGELKPEWVTDAFAKLTGVYDRPLLEVLDRWQDLVHPDDRDIEQELVLRAYTGKETVREFRIVTATGDIRWLRVYLRPVHDEVTGELAQIIGAAQDVTDRREVEETLRSAFRRERDAAARLREADQLKDEFITTASHELRTPLTSIVGFATALARQGSTLSEETQTELAEKLARNALELGGMVERLLDFSRLQAGTVRVEPARLNLADAILRCAETHAAALAHHRLVIDVAAEVEVLADREAIGHVVGNLLTNAAKYSPEGSTIVVAGGADGENVVVSVSDEGIGIPEAAVPRLFDRFYRGPDQPAGKRGSGVGLAIARSYVNLMGGQIWVETATETGGSTFSFTLPRPRPADGTPGREGEGWSPGLRTRAPGR